MTPKLLVSSLALDAGVVLLVGAFLSWDTDPVSDTSRILWLVGVALLAVVAGVATFLALADSAEALQALAAVGVAALVLVLGIAPAAGLDPGYRLLLVEGVVATLAGAAGLISAVAARRRSLV